MPSALGLTGEQRDLRDAVRGLLRRHKPAGPAAPDAGDRAEGEGPGYDEALWRRLCREIGVAGLAVPRCYGGAGAGPAEVHVVMEELGRGLTPSPMLGSVLVAAALLASGDAGACARLLPAIADGAVAALAWTTAAGHWDPGEAAFGAGPGPRDGAWVLDGEAHYVLDGDAAAVLLAAGRTPDGAALFEVDPGGAGVTRRAVTTMDTTRRLATVRLGGAAGRPIGSAGQAPGRAALARARDLACIALSAEQVGAAQRALELTVAYTKARVQFGRAIGSFQALQHRMAGLHVLVESARSVSYAAAAAAEAACAGAGAGAAGAGAGPGGPRDEHDLGLRAAAAKAYCSETLVAVAGEMIQLHGAIGVTWEHDAHRYLKRAHGAAHLFGRPAEHIARIAAAVVDG